MRYKEALHLIGLAKKVGLFDDSLLRTMIAGVAIDADPEIYEYAQEYINFRLTDSELRVDYRSRYL